MKCLHASFFAFAGAVLFATPSYALSQFTPAVSSAKQGFFTQVVESPAPEGLYRIYANETCEFSYMGHPSFHSSGWSVIPSTNVFGPQPNTAGDTRNLTTYVVGKNGSTAGCLYATRQMPSSCGPSTAWPQWSAWNDCGGYLLSMPAIANFTTYSQEFPVVEMHIFGVGLNNGLWRNVLSPGGSQSGWHPVPGAPTNLSPVVQATGFPDHVAVCVYSTSRSQYSCANYTPAGWSAWSNSPSVPGTDINGQNPPGLSQSSASGVFNIYAYNSSTLVPYMNSFDTNTGSWGTWTQFPTSPNPSFPNNTGLSATYWWDTLQNSASQLVCGQVSSSPSSIRCNRTVNGVWQGWF